ncbi:hypothetical protein P3S67_027569 [Capsicum chacoense]
MNRDSGPSFSLGFSQLESIKESQQLVNFVLRNIGYDFAGFDENRLKHRNYPKIVKKLRQKHAKKDKKKETGSKKRGFNGSASKAPTKRRRIVEAICRDELPKYVDVIMYYLWKKYKNKNFPINRYTTADCFFKVYIDKAYVNYYEADVGKDLATQDASPKTDEVADMEMSLINTIKGFSPCAGNPCHLVNEFFVPINCDSAFHRVFTVIALKDQCIHVYDSMTSSRKRTQTRVIEKLAVIILTYLQYSDFFKQKVPTNWTTLASYKGKIKRDPFQVEYVSEIAQKDLGSLDCGVFVAVYVEYL